MKKSEKREFFKVKSFDFLVAPLLLAMFPILSFYLDNISELPLKFVGKPLVYSIIASIGATLIFSVFLKNKRKSSIIVSLFVFIFFSYGHLSRSLNSRLFIPLPKGIVLGPDKVLLPIIFGLFFIFVFKILKSKKTFFKEVSFLNLSLLILVGYLGVAIIIGEYKKRNGEAVVVNEAQEEVEDILENSPDIYYIILDGYARGDVLSEIYDYDNSEFIDSLEKMGFYVADQARSNYIHTYLSLPSSLNMRYLDELPKKYGTNPVSGDAARGLVGNSEVFKRLKDYGYTIINFASSWEGTNESYPADITYKEDKYFKMLGKNIAIDEVNITFLQNTLLSPLIKQVWGDALRTNTLAALQKLPTIGYQEGKKFTIAHIITPHPPYVFNADGSPVVNAEYEMADEGVEKRPKYLGQLTFISDQIIPVLQNIIKNSKNPPVIVLQSDHGPASIFGKREEWLENYSEEGVKERSSILYAVYFPDQDYENFYSTITPVNTFRMIFNKYFGKDLELLPDETFYTSYEAIYDFKDVTDIK